MKTSEENFKPNNTWMQVDHIGTPKKDIHGEREREREGERGLPP